MLERICTITGKPFTVSDMHLEALRNIGTNHPMIREALPVPSIHPFELVRHIMCQGTVIVLHSTKSSISGTPTLSRISPAAGMPICTYDEFQSDLVDNRKEGRPYDFSRPFFDQLGELMRTCYLPPLNNSNNENCSFTNATLNTKNAYLTFVCFDSEDCLYGLMVTRCRECIDCVSITDCELCAECLDCSNCYNCIACSFCSDNCSNLFGCEDMKGCRDCYGCVGLTHQQYCIFNKQVTEEEYKAFMARKNIQTYNGYTAAIAECQAFCKSTGHQPEMVINSSNSTGWYLRDCQNVEWGHSTKGAENSGYTMSNSDKAKNCWFGFNTNAENCYAGTNVGGNEIIYSYSVFGGGYNIYCFMLQNGCDNCFGCVGLKKNSYCILNKQYTKEEYEDLVPRIIAHMKATGEWGQVIPPRLSPVPVLEANIEIYCQTYSTLGDAELQRRGYRIGSSPEMLAPADALDVRTLEDDVRAIAPEELLGKVFRCPATGRPLTYQAKEIALHIKLGYPLPRLHWRKRMTDLNQQRQLVPAV